MSTEVREILDRIQHLPESAQLELRSELARIEEEEWSQRLRYEQCPLCGSRDIHLGQELLPVTGADGRKTNIQVRRWKCGNCGEAYLTPESRRPLDKVASRDA